MRQQSGTTQQVPIILTNNSTFNIDLFNEKYYLPARYLYWYLPIFRRVKCPMTQHKNIPYEMRSNCVLLSQKFVVANNINTEICSKNREGVLRHQSEMEWKFVHFFSFYLLHTFILEFILIPLSSILKHWTYENSFYSQIFNLLFIGGWL